MPEDRSPAVPGSAFDFLAMVRGKEQIPGAAAYAVLDDDMRSSLDGLLASYNQTGNTPSLDRQAHMFLVSYRELVTDRGVLTNAELGRLNQILEERPNPQRFSAPQRRRSPHVRPPRGVLFYGSMLVVALVVVLACTVGIRAWVNSMQSGPPPGTSAQHPPAQQVQPGNTDLQNLEQVYKPWNTVAPTDQRPQTGQPGLLLLNGGYSVSTKWTVPPNASGWRQDLIGDVTNVDVHGNYVDITDAEGNPYVVGVNQPFVFSGNPGTVIRVDSIGNVYSIDLAQATAVRRTINK